MIDCERKMTSSLWQRYKLKGTQSTKTYDYVVGLLYIHFDYLKVGGEKRKEKRSYIAQPSPNDPVPPFFFLTS